MELFMLDSNTEITSDKLREFITSHEKRKIKYRKLKAMYEGDHVIKYTDVKELNKPDNKLVVNFAKYIVDTLNGYFIGNPIKTVHENPNVADQMKIIAKRNSQNDNNAELSKLCSIYGHAYEMLYQDQDNNTRVTYINPMESFVIYDDTVEQSVMYGVRVIRDDEKKVSGTIYTHEYEQDFYENDKSEIVFESEKKDHFFGDVPIIEYIENEERQSAFENVETLINAYNKAISEKANDVDYFADAYLAILGVDIDTETLDQIRDNRIINLRDGDTNKIIVEFLDKPNADTTQENLIDRLEQLIFQISMVANVSDENFAGESSGIALKYKLLSMENVALMKERKFINGMNKRFKMMFQVPTNFGIEVNKEEYLHIDYTLTRNIPNNMVEEAETAEKLAGITSKRTQLSVLSVVDNVQDEIDAMEEEKESMSSEMDAFMGSMNQSFNRNVV